MQKALEDRSEPFLALLAWRNTPSEQLGQSPSQMMFSRRTRTHLPTTDRLMASAFNSSAQDSLSLAKEHQASYYNRGAREKPPLAVGDVGRTRRKSGEECDKAIVVDVLPHRSYQVQFEDGTTHRRSSRHVRFSREPRSLSETKLLTHQGPLPERNQP